MKRIVLIVGLLLGAGCGVKKSPMPLFGYPATIESPSPSASPSPGGAAR